MDVLPQHVKRRNELAPGHRGRRQNRAQYYNIILASLGIPAVMPYRDPSLRLRLRSG